MLKQVDEKKIKKWTELDVLGKPIKRTYIKGIEHPLYSCMDFALILYNNACTYSDKQWNLLLKQFSEDNQREYFLIGGREINNLYISDKNLNEYLIDIDYDKDLPEEIKKKRSIYTCLFVNPVEYNTNTSQTILENNNIFFKRFLASLKTHKTKTFPFRGVHKAYKDKYKIKVYNGLHKTFDTIEEAARAYDKQIYEKYGAQVIPYLNFPQLYQKQKEQSVKDLLIPSQADKNKLPDVPKMNTNMKVSVELEKYIDFKISEKMVSIVTEFNNLLISKIQILSGSVK